MNLHAPAVRFCTGSGGRRIAYAVDGDGPPLVCAAWWVSHLELDFEDARFRRLFGTLAEHRTVVRYDRGGVGLSDRNRSSFDFASEVLDLEAVADSVGLDRFDLLGISCGGPPSVVFSARHPERVERLLLYGSFLEGSSIGREEVRRAVRDLVHAHWGLGLRAIVDLFAPHLGPEEVKRWTERQRKSASSESATALLELTYAMDARASAAEVRAPTRVLHRRHDRTVPFECGRALAAAIPGASLVALEGEAHVPWEGDAEAFLGEVRAFLNPGSARSAGVADASAAELRREGDVWLVRFGGRGLHVKHSKGLADLAVLVAHPAEPVHVLNLLAGSGEPREILSRQPVFDERALVAIKRRLDDLTSEISDAESDADLGRLERLRERKEALLTELRVATGRGGRVRSMPDATERARKAVTGRIRDSIEHIRGVHPELARHFDESIRTGIHCSYEPKESVAWRT